MALAKFQNHLWYISSDVVPMAFYDDIISIEIKRKMLKSRKVLIVNNLRVVNDPAEMGIKLISNYCKDIKCNEKDRQDMILVVAKHSQDYPLKLT